MLIHRKDRSEQLAFRLNLVFHLVSVQGHRVHVSIVMFFFAAACVQVRRVLRRANGADPTQPVARR